MTAVQTAVDTIEIVTLKDPAAGDIVEIAAGNRLDVRFSGPVASHWELVERPCNLVPLAVRRRSFSFLAFRSDEPVHELVLRRSGVRGGETRVVRVLTKP